MRTHDSSVPVMTGRFLTRRVALWAALAQRRVGDCSRDDVRDDARSIGMLSPTVQACEHHSCESMRLNFLPLLCSGEDIDGLQWYAVPCVPRSVPL